MMRTSSCFNIVAGFIFALGGWFGAWACGAACEVDVTQKDGHKLVNGWASYTRLIEGACFGVTQLPNLPGSLERVFLNRAPGFGGSL